MVYLTDIKDDAKKSANKKILFLPHAIRQMSRFDRMISVQEIKNVIMEGEVIEDYPVDTRGHSCLIMGLDTSNRPIHLVCAPKKDYLAIITAYLPDLEDWLDGYKNRRIP